MQSRRGRGHRAFGFSKDRLIILTVARLIRPVYIRRERHMPYLLKDLTHIRGQKIQAALARTVARPITDPRFNPVTIPTKKNAVILFNTPRRPQKRLPAVITRALQ